LPKPRSAHLAPLGDDISPASRRRYSLLKMRPCQTAQARRIKPAAQK
jgi:hypothetical protein